MNDTYWKIQIQKQQPPEISGSGPKGFLVLGCILIEREREREKGLPPTRQILPLNRLNRYLDVPSAVGSDHAESPPSYPVNQFGAPALAAAGIAEVPIGFVGPVAAMIPPGSPQRTVMKNWMTRTVRDYCTGTDSQLPTNIINQPNLWHVWSNQPSLTHLFKRLQPWISPGRSNYAAATRRLSKQWQGKCEQPLMRQQHPSRLTPCHAYFGAVSATGQIDVKRLFQDELVPAVRGNGFDDRLSSWKSTVKEKNYNTPA